MQTTKCGAVSAGQFAIREVIKQLEGAQYVRSYWDMDHFYAFSGGAPEVYLTYARWLAKNAIAQAPKITGKITVSGQRIQASDGGYIGTVTLTTDADLIRISKAAGSITGNSGGSDEAYYYVKSGDTIRILSDKSSFSVYMESIATDSKGPLWSESQRLHPESACPDRGNAIPAAIRCCHV